MSSHAHKRPLSPLSILLRQIPSTYLALSLRPYKPSSSHPTPPSLQPTYTGPLKPPCYGIPTLPQPRTSPSPRLQSPPHTSLTTHYLPPSPLHKPQPTPPSLPPTACYGIPNTAFSHKGPTHTLSHAPSGPSDPLDPELLWDLFQTPTPETHPIAFPTASSEHSAGRSRHIAPQSLPHCHASNRIPTGASGSVPPKDSPEATGSLSSTARPIADPGTDRWSVKSEGTVQAGMGFEDGQDGDRKGETIPCRPLSDSPVSYHSQSHGLGGGVHAGKAVESVCCAGVDAAGSTVLCVPGEEGEAPGGGRVGKRRIERKGRGEESSEEEEGGREDDLLAWLGEEWVGDEGLVGWEEVLEMGGREWVR